MKRAIAILTLALSLAGEQRLERIASTASDLEIGYISSVAVSRAGEIFVVDGKAQQIVVYDSAGRRARTIGRKGAGPLEFRSLSKLAWLGDTLVAAEGNKRVTFIDPNGKLIRTIQWPAPEWPDIWLGPGGPTLLVVGYGRGRVEAVPGLKGSTHSIRPPKTFLQVRDSSVVRLAWPADPTADSVGWDCWHDPAQSIHILDEMPGGNGPFNAVTSKGDFIFLSPDRSRVFIQSPSGRPRAFGKAYAPVRVTDKLWNREGAEFAALEKKEGKLTCSKPFARPRTLPPIRAIAADDLGRLWVEVTHEDGYYYYDVYAPDGKLVITLGGHSRRVPMIPFVVRGDKLYTAEKDADDVVSITVYRWLR